MNDQMQGHNLFVDRFCFEPLAVWKADNQEQFTQARLRNQPTHPPTKVEHNLLDKAKKQLLDKAKGNWERLRKVANYWLAGLMKNCLVKPKTIKNGYAKDENCKQTKLQTTNQAIGQTTDWKHLFSEVKNNQTTWDQVNKQLRLTVW